MSRHLHERARMVERDLVARGLHDPAVLAAMREVPRERFVDPGMEDVAYRDSPLPIGERQTISQPYIVALMAEAALLRPGDVVLEVGTGSGYAAAVFAHVAAQVYTIERHATLARGAERRFAELGYDNIHVQVGDGSRGWSEHAPYDAIIVAAGAPEPPRALREQLAVGGRLVLPVGDLHFGQRLVRITRTGPDDFAHQDLGGVSFVPLVGEQGWTEQGDRALPRRSTHAVVQASLPQRIAAAAHPLPAIASPSFAEAFDRYGGRRVVLLGECSHGTAEFYDARAAITRMLVERHGFNIVAVEADWPDAAAINRHVRGMPQPSSAPAPFQRFPTWMWRNAEFARFADWLRRHNGGPGSGDAVGFYGLDLYNLHGAIAAVLDYLDRTDPEAAEVARERYGCLTPWQQDPATYGRAVLSAGYRGCEEAVVRQCRDLLERHLEQAGDDGAPLLDAAHSARVVASAERYYRVMYYGGAEAWNLRDRHMFETLDLLLQARGPRAKAVVWAHNSHIGDARHTDMGRHRDELNIGQLCRERFGHEAALIGFGTDHGTVAAAHDWGGDMQVMDVRPSRTDSVERLCHEAGRGRFLLELAEAADAGLRDALREDRLQRFIGVIYRPHSELLSHYAEVSLAEQFDAYVWFDETRAVTALGPQESLPGRVPETYPSGL